MSRRRRAHPELPAGLSPEEVIREAESQMFGMGNTGFCLECGAPRGGCEPDAEGYECYECGEHAVMGASDIVVRFL